MKKLVVILITAYCISANAYEYSSDNGENQGERHYHEYHGKWREYSREERIESGNGERYSFQLPRYGQILEQPSIQLYLHQNPRPRPMDKEFREERFWRERRRELENSPQVPYFENQFNRDDTHW